MCNRKISSHTKEKISTTRKKLIKDGVIVINSEKISNTITKKYLNNEFKWITGKFFSHKNNKEIYFRSSWEQTYMLLLEQDNNVVKWTYEPFAISYFYKNKKHNYIPDFFVETKNGNFLIEVKPSKLKNIEKNIAKREAAVEYCIENNLQYLEWSPQ